MTLGLRPEENVQTRKAGSQWSQENNHNIIYSNIHNGYASKSGHQFENFEQHPRWTPQTESARVMEETHAH